jgi:hypothetical protein
MHTCDLPHVRTKGEAHLNWKWITCRKRKNGPQVSPGVELADAAIGRLIEEDLARTADRKLLHGGQFGLHRTGAIVRWMILAIGIRMNHVPIRSRFHRQTVQVHHSPVGILK